MFSTMNLVSRRFEEIFHLIIYNNYLKNTQKHFYTSILIEMFDLKIKFLFCDT
jgi:hypothetical protein